MAVYGYTKNYKLIKPQFDTDTWHDYEYDNLDTIDAVLSAIFASGDWQGFWKTNTHYDAGGVVIDRDTDTMYKIMVEHTTSEDTFAEEFAAHPTYYELWSPNNLAEDWAIKMDGTVSNTDYSSKAYAISSALIDNGSAKEWAINSGAIGTTGEYSAKKYATDAHNDYISMTTNSNVVAVGTNIASVNTVGQSISNVNTVAGDISSVNTVAGISTDVTTVASISTAVSTVSDIESDVLDVADNRTDISTVATNIIDVNTVAGVAGDVSTVADNDTNVTTVATNISDVNTAATNIAAIQAAPTAASNAAASATLAQEWATKMDGQVASTDYSSKYYAGQSALSAQQAAISAAGTHFKLFQHDWFDYELDDMSWLRADTFSWQDGTVYSNAYNHLVADIDGVTTSTETVGGYTVTFYRAADGHKIVLADQETTIGNIYTAIGVAWYYVLDTVNNRFKLPRTKYGFDGLRDNVGDYIPESLPNITGDTITRAFSNASGSNVSVPPSTSSGAFVTKSATYVYLNGGTNKSMNVYEGSFDASRSSSSYQNGAPVQQRGTQMYLYFYAGQYTQSAIEQTAGLNAELFNNKADIDASNFNAAGKSLLSGLGMPSGNYIDLTLGASGSTYTAPANGYFVLWSSLNGNNYNTYIAIHKLNQSTVGSSFAYEAIVPTTYQIPLVAPVKRGEIINIAYTIGAVMFRFYYAEGEN